VLLNFSLLFGDTLPTRPRFSHFVGLVSTINFYVFNCLAYVELEYRVGEVLTSEGWCC
jgi:hypothetical protein